MNNWTKMGVIIILKNSNDVFNLILEFSNHGQVVGRVVHPIRYNFLGSDDDIIVDKFYLNSTKEFDHLEVTFEEHERYFRFASDSHSGEDVVYIYEEIPNYYDTPSYAGSYRYRHPNFKGTINNYYDINADCEEHMI